MALRPSSVPLRVVLPEPPASSLPHVTDTESDLARAASPTVTHLLATVVTDPDFESTATFARVTELVDFANRSCLDYVVSLVTESESVCPPSVRGEPALSSDILEDKQYELECLAAALPRFTSMLLCPEGDPDALDIPTPRSYAEAIAVSNRARFLPNFPPHPKDDYSSGAAARCSTERLRAALPQLLHNFFAGQPSRGDLAAPSTWLHWVVSCGTILVAVGFAPSSADPSLFLRNDTKLPPFYVLVYVDDLVFATTDTEALALVKAELRERHTCTDQGHFDASWADDQATQRSSQGHTFSLGSGSVSWRSTRSSSVLGSSCEAEIYTGAMAAQELRWLTYVLTDLGERPRSPPVLYVDNKAMVSLCHEQRLEHRTKHIALRYFLARELLQHRHLCLSYVALQANTADVFTKTLGSGDHQRFCTALGLVSTLPHLLVA
ncbi:unnamed protein product [Closterium sp. NIES-54]